MSLLISIEESGIKKPLQKCLLFNFGKQCALRFSFGFFFIFYKSYLKSSAHRIALK